MSLHRATTTLPEQASPDRSIRSESPSESVRWQEDAVSVALSFFLGYYFGVGEIFANLFWESLSLLLPLKLDMNIRNQLF